MVTKPHLEVLRELVKLRHWRGQITFRFTIGSNSDNWLRFWEPGAPSFNERFDCLRLAHGEGFATSVSMEPMLDMHPWLVVDAVDRLITDTIWLGRANHLGARLAANKAPPEVVEAGRRLMAEQTDEWFRDLHARLTGNPKVRWKDSIARLVDLPASEVPA